MNAELLGSGNIPQNTQEDYFKNLTSLWDTVEDEVENFELQGKTDWKMPKWAEGIFVTSGPSKQDLEGTSSVTFLMASAGSQMLTSKIVKPYSLRRCLEVISTTDLFRIRQ